MRRSTENRVIARHASAVAISSVRVAIITAPINIEYFESTMLSSILAYRTALHEIPTGLRPSEWHKILRILCRGGW